MEKKFVQRNVNLLFLTDYLMAFFSREGLEAKKLRVEEGFKIVVKPSYSRDMYEAVIVYILGKPNDFTIKFVTGELSRSLVKWGRLTRLIGGGSFLLRGLKSQDVLEKLEKDFWMYVNEKIDYLLGSAKST